MGRPKVAEVEVREREQARRSEGGKRTRDEKVRVCVWVCVCSWGCLYVRGNGERVSNNERHRVYVNVGQCVSSDEGSGDPESAGLKLGKSLWRLSGELRRKTKNNNEKEEKNVCVCRCAWEGGNTDKNTMEEKFILKITSNDSWLNSVAGTHTVVLTAGDADESVLVYRRERKRDGGMQEKGKMEEAPTHQAVYPLECRKRKADCPCRPRGTLKERRMLHFIVHSSPRTSTRTFTLPTTRLRHNRDKHARLSCFYNRWVLVRYSLSCVYVCVCASWCC